MRFLYGIIAVFAISAFIAYAETKGVKISTDAQLLALAIAAAGAMAGGD